MEPVFIFVVMVICIMVVGVLGIMLFVGMCIFLLWVIIEKYKIHKGKDKEG